MFLGFFGRSWMLIVTADFLYVNKDDRQQIKATTAQMKHLPAVYAALNFTLVV